MSSQLRVSLGQSSDKGRKAINQDFHGACIPKEPQLSNKGIAIALADGISSSGVSHIASETAIANFLEDYYCTSEAWSVKKSAQKVLLAVNAWLHSQTRQSPFRYEKDKGYVCTFSAIVFKSATAHLFHVGDARIYRLHGTSLEQLTQDHRLWISESKSYLSRALGVDDFVDVDYLSLLLEPGDVFVLASDGVYEKLTGNFIANAINENSDDLNRAASLIVAEAFAQGSADNLTVQIARIDELPLREAEEVYQQLIALPFPPALEPRMVFDGYRIIREIHANNRSHVYLALDECTQTQVVIKTPSVELREDTAYLERFLMEEWVARRIHSPFVLKAGPQSGKRHFIYATFEYIEGQTLAQWMRDHPKPDLEKVRDMVEQIAKGLRAFHRQEMLHQDLRPENIMIDATGTLKIIDFGSTYVAGVMEIASSIEHEQVQGTAQFTAPEYFMGERGSACSDLYALGVIAYQLLSGKLPYGLDLVKCRTEADQRKLPYRSLLAENVQVPLWVDETIKKAVHVNPQRRYQELTEFVFDLRHPNKTFLEKTGVPLLERNPVLFWQCISLFLALVILGLLAFPSQN